MNKDFFITNLTGIFFCTILAIIIQFIFNQIETKELKQKMAKEFIKYYGDNILVESKLYKGVETFLKCVKKIIFRWQFVLIKLNVLLLIC